MSSKNHTIHLFSHLPKTGGTTVRKVIDTHYALGINYFHFAINGFKEMSHIGKSPFDTLNYLENPIGNNLILFGHRVNDGLLHNRMHNNVELTTMLRHPFSRLVSQYYMRINSPSSKFSKPLSKYFNAEKNPMCHFYVLRFPSFIGDPFDTLFKQASDVLSHFTNIKFLENAPSSIEEILNIFDLKYDPKFDSNIGSNKKTSKTVELSDLYDTFPSKLGQDLALYNTFINSTNKVTKPIDFQKVLRPNYWLVFFIRKFLSDYSFVQPYYDSIQNKTIKTLLQPQVKLLKIDYKILLNSISEIQNIESLSKELQSNLFDLFDYSLLKIENISEIKISNHKSFYGNILSILKIKKVQNIQDLKHDIVMNFPDNHHNAILAKFNYLQQRKEYHKAIDKLYWALKIYPLSTKIFEKLYNIAKTVNDKELASKCFMKIIELSPSISKQYISNQYKLRSNKL